MKLTKPKKDKKRTSVPWDVEAKSHYFSTRRVLGIRGLLQFSAKTLNYRQRIGFSIHHN